MKKLVMSRNGHDFVIWEEQTCWVIATPVDVVDVSTFNDVVDTIEYYIENIL